MPLAIGGENRAPSRAVQGTTAAAALTALGIVFGDLGTSPLYTLQTVVQIVGVKLTPQAALGILSLILWSLLITISVKYCLFVMPADNHGEGGILALMSLTGAKWSGRGRLLVAMGLFGAALIYGDGIITPAISVLSALEGLDVATNVFKPHIVPMAVAILLGLFAIQPRGTAQIARISGPVMLVWFIVIAALGLGGIALHPGVLAAADPRYAIGFLAGGGWGGFALLGGVFLAITGGEALYADMGHIGRNPIRTTWYGVVLPALVLNYAGQTALLFEHPAMDGNPFFRLAPVWAIFPLVVLASVATVIASQAIITGSFSLTRQAMQLGWFPGLRIRQTSADEYGQIYVPFVNWTMMLVTVALTIRFGSSVRLAAAYGTAVSTTMVLTTGLLYTVMRVQWSWSARLALLTTGVFFVVDLAFFAANLLKVTEGGWIPLTLGLILFVIMTTWRSGIDAVHDKLATMTVPPEEFLKRLQEDKITRVPGTAVFLTRITDGMPPLMVEHLAQIGALHQALIALTVKFGDAPRVRSPDRLTVVRVFDGFWRVTVRYGFIEVPDLPAELRTAEELTCHVNLDRVVYFAAHDEVVHGRTAGALSWWRLRLFAFLLRNSVRASDLFNLPASNLVELGRQIEV
jgi:KUP system potassium uptake protein